MKKVIGPMRPDQKRADGWSNLVTLLGTSADKRTSARINWENHPPEFYEQLYAGGGIPARIVDLIPDESLRHWIEWDGVDKKTAERINDVCEALDVRGALLKSWKWGRAFGGAVCHIVTDTRDPAGPLQIGERVIGLRDLSRWDLRILTTDVEYDFGSPNWGHPRIYYLNVQMGSQFKGYPIHWTRMIRFDGQLVPRRTYIRNSYWHDSILNRLYNSIRNYETSNDAAAACLQDFNVDVFKMKNLANMMAAGQEQLVQSRIEMLSYAKSVLNSMIIDADEEDYENKARTMQGVADLLVLQANRLVAETDIPHTKLLGESPDGSQATGNSTSQQWYNFINSEQENYLRPKLKRLIEIIFPDIKGLGFKFKSLRVLDEPEKADVRLKTAQADQIYLDAGVLDPTEVTESRFGGDEWTMETKIDKEARAAGLIVPHAEPDDGENGDDNDGPSDDKQKKSDADAMSVAGDQPPEGRSRKVTPSEPEPTIRGHEGAGGDLSGIEQEVHPSTGVEGQGIGEIFNPGEPGAEFGLKNEVIAGGTRAIEKTFISQTMSEPMRDPRTDPHLKGPGIPNKPRTFLPTRGTGITAPSGYDFQKDAGSSGEAVEPSLRADQSEEKPERKRAATVIVRKGDHFLMGKTRDGDKWTLPGGIVESHESMHQGGVRELLEETGLEAKRLKFLGSRLVESEMGKPVEVAMYEYNADDDFKPTGKNDPDQEVGKWQWFNSKKPLTEDVLGSLKHANNIALDHLGLLK